MTVNNQQLAPQRKKAREISFINDCASKQKDIGVSWFGAGPQFLNFL